MIALFRDELGYQFLGDWTDHSGNSNIEEVDRTGADWSNGNRIAITNVSRVGSSCEEVATD